MFKYFISFFILVKAYNTVPTTLDTTTDTTCPAGQYRSACNG